MVITEFIAAIARAIAVTMTRFTAIRFVVLVAAMILAATVTVIVADLAEFVITAGPGVSYSGCPNCSGYSSYSLCYLLVKPHLIWSFH